MASLYKRGEWFWIAYYANGEHVQKSLGTNNERIAKEKQKRIEYELSIGELQAASRLPIRTVLQKFCEHLQVTRTFKSCKNDVSRLRVFFGPICEALELGLPGGWSKTETPKRPVDQYAQPIGRAGNRVLLPIAPCGQVFDSVWVRWAFSRSPTGRGHALRDMAKARAGFGRPVTGPVPKDDGWVGTRGNRPVTFASVPWFGWRGGF
jgi:hypothetical protein